MDRPLPDPAKLLEAWMEWERGDTPPGRVISTLKTAGLRILLEQLVEAKARAAEPKGEAAEESPAATESWTPVV